MNSFATTGLTLQELAEATRWLDKQPKSVILKHVQWHRANKYLNENLSFATLEQNDRMYYRSAKDQYTRNDGLPITQDDIDAILARDHGQGNQVIGKAGDMSVVHSWCCDSSD